MRIVTPVGVTLVADSRKKVSFSPVYPARLSSFSTALSTF